VLCSLVGIIIAYVFVWISMYYTDYNHEPIRLLALSSSAWHGTIFIVGVSLGLESTTLPVPVISVAIISAYWLGQISDLVDDSGNPTGGLLKMADGFAGVFPEHEYEIVKRLQARKHICRMNGDGVNDTLALKKANIGIAVRDEHYTGLICLCSRAG
jgi:hypothetical protein